MLDNLKIIHEKDGQDALGIASKQSQQLEQEFEIAAPAGVKITNIVFAGMGGSALAALLARSWPSFGAPFEVVRSYEIPTYVNSETLFIASSYSGNTEETLSALAAAEKTGAQIAIITSGGKLGEIAAQKNYPIAKLPNGFQPRFATLYNLKGLLSITDAFGVTDNKAVELASKSQYVQQITTQWQADSPTASNQAKQIALELVGKSAIIYGGDLTAPAAYKWKISCNENAKNLAWCNNLPEANHNEILGWISHPLDKPFAVVDLVSSHENERVQKRFSITSKLLSGKRPESITVKAEGQDALEDILYCVIMGDFVSLYLALLNGINPTPVEIIEKLKQELAA